MNQVTPVADLEVQQQSEPHSDMRDSDTRRKIRLNEKTEFRPANDREPLPTGNAKECRLRQVPNRCGHAR